MKLDEAIDTLNEIIMLTGIGDNDKDKRAIHLGIEALEIIDKLQLAGDPISPGLLPGQTEEGG